MEAVWNTLDGMDDYEEWKTELLEHNTAIPHSEDLYAWICVHSDVLRSVLTSFPAFTEEGE